MFVLNYRKETDDFFIEIESKKVHFIAVISNEYWDYNLWFKSIT